MATPRSPFLVAALATVLAWTGFAVAPAAADPEPAVAAAACASGTFSDPRDDAALDISSFTVVHDCETNLVRFDISTYDTWDPSRLYAVAAAFDVDRNNQTGCRVDQGGTVRGIDYTLLSQRTNSGGDRSTRLFQMNSCSDLVDRGPAYFEILSKNSVRLELNRTRIGDPVDVVLGVYVEDIFEQLGTGDTAPDAGVAFSFSTNVGVCTRCYFFTNELRGGIAENEFSFARSDDIVFAGDWDGDGDDTLGVRRGSRYYLMSRLRGGVAETEFTYGLADDEVFIGDWNGDGVDTLGVRRGKTFYLTNRQKGGNADVVFSFGRPGDVVIVGDWNGDGIDTLMVRRGRTYYQTNKLVGGNAETVFTYGLATDEVFVGDWDANRTDTLGVRRGNKFFLTNSQRSGNADITFSFGRSSDRVLIGDWDADGVDTIGIRR